MSVCDLLDTPVVDQQAYPIMYEIAVARVIRLRLVFFDLEVEVFGGPVADVGVVEVSE